MTVTKRKFQASSSGSDEFDPASQVSTIEFYFASKDPARVVAGLHYATPWPYDIARVSENTRQVIDRVRTRYEEILRKHNITHHREFLQSISPKYSARYTDTLVILSNDDNKYIWQFAADEIQEIIDQDVRNQRPGERKIRVELRNHEEMYRDVSSAVNSGTPEHASLLRTQDLIIEKVKKLCLSNWTIISWVMRGRPSAAPAERRPTVMVKVKPGARSMWLHIEEELRRALDELPDLGRDVSVELAPGSMLPRVSSDIQPSQPKFIRELPLPPRPGASIGPRGCDEAGTLGPWVYLQMPGGQRIMGFITAHHVISPGDPRNLIVNDLQGIGLEGRPVLNGIIVDYPAPFDAKEIKAKLEEEIRNGQSVEENRKTLAAMQDLIDAGGFGTVMYSSGYWRDNAKDHRMDWSFVRVNNPEHFGSNLTAKKAPDGVVTDAMLGGSWIKYNHPGERITGLGDPKLDSWVLKHGRTSDTTSGQVTALKAACHRKDGSHTMEVQVMNLQYHTAFPMLQPGDSGAMMYNENKEWVGLGIAIDSSDDSAFITPSKEIVDDIQAKTGGIITLE